MALGLKAIEGGDLVLAQCREKTECSAMLSNAIATDMIDVAHVVE